MAGLFDSSLGGWGDGSIEFSAPPPRSASVANERDSRGKSSDDYDREEQEYIEYLRDAMKASSGWRREQLAAQLDEAEAERESRIEAAKISANASKYGSDRSLEGTKYASDNSRAASQYGADRSLEGTRYSADASSGASRYGSDRSLEGTKYSSDASRESSKYGADRSLEGTKYGVDADLYKFDASQPLERADRALALINSYAQMSSNPANIFQSSEIARLGRQVNGMPTYIRELLGQTAASPVSRVAAASLPGNQAQAVFGDNPLAGPGVVQSGGMVPMPQTVMGGGSGGTVFDANGRAYSVAGMRAQAQGGAAPRSGSTWAGQTGLASGMVPSMTADYDTAALRAGQTMAEPRTLAQRGMLISPEQEAINNAALDGFGEAIRRGAHTWGNGTLEGMDKDELGALESAAKMYGVSFDRIGRTYEQTRNNNDLTAFAQA